jgi:hypothetical protein
MQGDGAMTMISAMVTGGFAARVAALEAEFGAILAGRIMEAEALDFVWEARLKERYLGQHFDVCFPPDDEDVELSRVAVLSAFGGSWHAGVCLVDGDGQAVDLLWKQTFDCRELAEAAFVRGV